MTESPSGPERVQSAFPLLVTAANELNAASDELGKTITELDAALQNLNLGVAAWVPFSDGSDEYSYWSREIGYTKLGNSWGIALREVDGVHHNPEEETVQSWGFNNAPRWMRIDGIAKIPDLLEKLIKQAEDTTKKIKKKNEQAKELTAAIKLVAANSKIATKK